MRNNLLDLLPDYLDKFTQTVKSNKFFKTHIAKVFHSSINKIYACRSLFAIYSFEKWGGNSEKNYFISQILEHEDEALETAFRYNNYIVPKNSSYNLKEFNIEEKLQINLNGRSVSRAKSEAIKENPHLKKSFLQTAEGLIIGLENLVNKLRVDQ